METAASVEATEEGGEEPVHDPAIEPSVAAGIADPTAGEGEATEPAVVTAVEAEADTAGEEPMVAAVEEGVADIDTDAAAAAAGG